MAKLDGSAKDPDVVVGLTARDRHVFPDLKNVPNRLWNSPGFLLAKVGEQVESLFAAILRPHHISPREYGVLLSIVDQGAQSQHELGVRLGIDRSTMVKIIDDLEANNLVIRARGTVDRRCYAIAVSEQGEILIKQILAEVSTGTHDHFMSVLSEDERDKLLDMLRRLIEANS